MRKSAKLSDLIVKVREDEKSHSIINHKYADLNTNEPIVENNPQIKESLLNNYKLEKFSEGIIYQVKYVWMNILIIGRHIKKKAT